ncbi:hypothetical protein KO527_09310 [Pseudoalteromonas sp. C2R02]|uniref:serine O-acetyltransferase n=1 Tax=Pseudoalteromonas sp. C2R02 TaxID=2841565 RepID=UPI001C08A8B6|nr:hypothetical protein [Pseudoalteromonas sp. C2R02]MBU2969540.1 hypothetical protein [Pseudoalteromonas sp. C2R02]
MTTLVSSIIPDWERERPRKFWDPSRKLLLSIRKYQAINKNSFSGKLISKYWVFIHRFWSVITGAEIDLSCQIGGGLLIPHPNGIVIHAYAKIGVNCLIFQQVTIGSHEDFKAPVIRGHVDIGAGAKILGIIEVGEHAKIGANAVVVKNVEALTTVVGIPAKVV